MLPAYNHPSMDEVVIEPAGVISVYNGVEIPTKRKATGRLGYGDLDPRNSRLAALVSNRLEMDQLDNDELRYGITKCDDGKFSAKAAWQAHHLVPATVRGRMIKELVRRASDKLSGSMMAAVDTIIELATSPAVDDKERMKAATYIIERTAGKTPDVVIHTQEKPWETVVTTKVRRGPRPPRTQLEDGNTVEAEIVDEQRDTA